MTGIDYFAWLILIVIVVSLVVALVMVAQLPGRIARARNHPQADAINMAGWLGLLFTLGIVWVFAMIWANTTHVADFKSELGAVKARLAELERKLVNAPENHS